MIHTTVGVYNSGEQKTNGVPSELLASHIKHNITRRPGRALFVDGLCVHIGYLGFERCDDLEPEIAMIEIKEDTAPYH